MKKPNRRQIVTALLTMLFSLGLVATAAAHGVIITYTLGTNGQVDLVAEFDTGEAMSEAQVAIYAPIDPANPWLTGIADAEGRYTFVIDPEITGTWDVQYRKAGHGDFVHLQLEAGMVDPALMTQSPGAVLSNAPVEQQPAAAKAEPVAESPVVSGGNIATTGGFNSFQILLMSASVIWGFVGTALYFSSKKSQDHGHAHGHGHHH